jgi:hypothetical protein
MIHNVFILYRITGLIMTVKAAPAHVEIERPMLAGAQATGLSHAALRERGNALVQRKDWKAASVAYSLSVVLSFERVETPDVKMEAAKALANRSFVHLQLAKAMVTSDPEAIQAVETNAAVRLMVAEAKARGTGRMGDGPVPPPDLMEVLRGATLVEAVAQGRLEPWRMHAVVAFADANRADHLAPQWAKPIGRQAEAARFLAMQSAREGDGHGLSAMAGLATSCFQQAAEREREREPASKKQYETLFRHMKHVYPDQVGEAVSELLAMRGVLARLEEEDGITSRQLQRAGFRMPPPRADEEDRVALFREALHSAIRSSPSLHTKYMNDPVNQACGVPQGATGEWWSLACTSVGPCGEDGLQLWVITIVDSTEKSLPKDATEAEKHPWHNRLLHSCTIRYAAMPAIEQIMTSLVSAICLPAPGSGPPRRPERLCVPWRMRHIYDELKELGEELRIKVSVVAQSVSLPAEANQHVRLAAQKGDHSGGTERGESKKKKAKKKK